MREILFRGKRIDNGEWVEGFLLKECNYATCSWNLAIEHKTDRFGKFAYDVAEINPETVGQYTGLTDKNGKKIFEGDIIKIPDDYDEFGISAGEIYEVYFAFGGFRLKPKYSKAKGFWLEDDETVEIIGNIHDNPELLQNP
jgi:uncharacterized phage protein (TIGR01671 family)